jgi:hypothetical protein
MDINYFVRNKYASPHSQKIQWLRWHSPKVSDSKEKSDQRRNNQQRTQR